MKRLKTTPICRRIFAERAGFEAAVLDLFQRRVGFDVAFFSVKGEEASPTVVGLDEALVDTAVRGGPRYAAELLPIKRAALQARGVAVDTRVLGERGVSRSAYYREVARAVGGRHSLMAYVPLRGKIRVVPVMRASEDYAPSALRNVVLIASKGE